MNNADTAAACRMCAHRQNSKSGVRNIPPPVPVSPERKPRPAPTLMAVGCDGVRRFGGSLRERSNVQRRKAAPAQSKFLRRTRMVAGIRRNKQPELKVAQMARTISTQNGRRAKIGTHRWTQRECLAPARLV